MELLHSIKNQLILGFLSLPLLLISFLGFLSLGIGNVGLFVLFLGHALMVPFTVGLTHLAVDKATTPDVNMRFHVDASDRAVLVPSKAAGIVGQINVAPSWWMAHVLFFMTYLITNASYIYSMKQEAGVSDWLYENRRARSLSVLIFACVMTVLLIYLRVKLVGTETLAGIGIGILTMVPIGYGWYRVAQLCGARHADLFGIVQLILPKSAKNDAPMTCIYAAKP